MTTTPHRQRVARSEISRALKSEAHAFVIHYARDDFALPVGRVTAIAARNLASGQARLFSITKCAPNPAAVSAATPSQLDVFERKMLDDFFSFVGQHNGHFWLHWNMRDARYGFEQLADRHRALGGSPVAVPDHDKVDLASRMFDLYGDRYAAPPNRLETLAARNGVNISAMLTGAEQAHAISVGDYLPVDASILRKVDALYVIARKTHSGHLKTDGGWWDRHGGTVGAVGKWVTTHWVFSAILAVMALAGFIALF
jgi:hypothetical protein